MATKLKKMKLTSVDLVRAGANQEADICLFKSADPPEATESPTEDETSIFKRFLEWMHKNPTEDASEPQNPIEKADDMPDLEFIYKSALSESLHSIMSDDTLTEIEKKEMSEESLRQYADKIRELERFDEDYNGGDDIDDDLLEDIDNDDPVDEDHDDHDDDDDRYDEIEEVHKFNPYHGYHGYFSTAEGATSMTFKPGASRAHDNAIAREKERTGSSSSGSSGGSSSSGSKGKNSKTDELKRKYEEAFNNDDGVALMDINNQMLDAGMSFDDIRALRDEVLDRRLKDPKGRATMDREDRRVTEAEYGREMIDELHEFKDPNDSTQWYQESSNNKKPSLSKPNKGKVKYISNEHFTPIK